MATMITAECINCGACEPECPNTAIYQGGVEWLAPDGATHPPLSNDIFYIVPEKCTECVGFFDQEACAKVCPVDCCVPNPAIPEAESVLLARARTLHPDKTIPDDAPSRFKAEGAAGAVAPAAGAAAAAPAPAAAPAAAAPAKPAAAAAAAAPVVRGRVEKPVYKPTPRPSRTYAGEIPAEYEQLLADLGSPRRSVSWSAILPLTVLAVSQGLLGALSARTKERIEAAICDHRFFDAQLATAANIFLNLVLYPILCVVVAVGAGRTDVFTGGVHRWITLGVTLAAVEAMRRLRETLFHGVPLTETPLRGAIYAPVVWPLGRLVMLVAGERGVASGVAYDGFSGGQERFDEKLERARRYGEVYQLEERDDAYLLRVEFPRALPPSSLGEQLDLPDEMPDYDFDLELKDGAFLVTGRVIDPHVRRLTGVAPAFPSTFTTRVALRAPVAGFRHRYRDKTLEVVLPKAAAR
jgi:ferredoxin